MLGLVFISLEFEMQIGLQYYGLTPAVFPATGVLITGKQHCPEAPRASISVVEQMI